MIASRRRLHLSKSMSCAVNVCKEDGIAVELTMIWSQIETVTGELARYVSLVTAQLDEYLMSEYASYQYNIAKLRSFNRYISTLAVDCELENDNEANEPKRMETNNRLQSYYGSQRKRDKKTDKNDRYYSFLVCINDMQCSSSTCNSSRDVLNIIYH